MSDSGSSRAASPAPDGLQQPDSAALPPGDEQPADDSLETSFFPAPAPYYTRYTSDNLSLPLTASIQLPTGQEISRAELEPPNIDWIVEEGNYSVFGETWPIEEKLPTLAEMGVRELFDPTVGKFQLFRSPFWRRLIPFALLLYTCTDRSSSLLNLLRTLLLTYTQLLTSLLSPPPSLTSVPPGAPEPPTDPERLVEHTRLIGVNMHHLVNELRPVQVRLPRVARRSILLLPPKLTFTRFCLASLLHSRSSTPYSATIITTRTRPARPSRP